MKRVRLLTGYIGEALQAHWLLIHALVAPWGTLIITGVLVNLDGANSEIWVFWRHWGDIGAMSSTVSYGAAVYGCAVSAMEVTVRMVFYAIAKFLEEQDRRREEKMRREEERERQFAEVVSEARNEGRNEGRMEGIDLVLKNPNLQQYPDLHQRIAKELEEALGEDERGDTTGG